MGNLVTNRVQLSAEAGSIPEARIGEIVSALAGLPADPDLQLEAKGYDEDTDYAFSAVSDGAPGEVEWMEECSPDAVEEAKNFVFPGRNASEEELDP